ncbi:MAG: hypothetical protein V7L23_14005 [Nostoc sp.]|uniref:hypothetical protein n=1 Tax=Nostoc sp. TaxID=1180 RepID=UPI002FF168B0
MTIFSPLPTGRRSRGQEEGCRGWGVGCRGRHWTELGLRPMQSSLTTGLVSQRLLGLFLSLHPTPYTLHPAPTGLGQSIPRMFQEILFPSYKPHPKSGWGS